MHVGGVFKRLEYLCSGDSVIQVCVCVFVFVCGSVSVFACVCVCVCLCLCECVCVCLCVCACSFCEWNVACFPSFRCAAHRHHMSARLLMQAFGCEGECLAGMVVASPEAWRLISRDIAGAPLPSGRVVLSRVAHPLRVRALSRSLLPPSGGARDLLQSYVPAAIVPHLRFHTHSWASELRTVTVMFLNLGFRGSQLTVRACRPRAGVVCCLSSVGCGLDAILSSPALLVVV